MDEPKSRFADSGRSRGQLPPLRSNKLAPYDDKSDSEVSKMRSSNNASLAFVNNSGK